MPHKAKATRAHPYGTRSQTRHAPLVPEEILSLDEFLAQWVSLVPEWVKEQLQPPETLALTDTDTDTGMPPPVF